LGFEADTSLLSHCVTSYPKEHAPEMPPLAVGVWVSRSHCPNRSAGSLAIRPRTALPTSV